jgi:hypothetical protein
MIAEYIIEIESFDSEKDAIAFAEKVLKGHRKAFKNGDKRVNVVSRVFTVVNVMGG